jgi:hypothetical protein
LPALAKAKFKPAPKSAASSKASRFLDRFKIESQARIRMSAAKKLPCRCTNRLKSNHAEAFAGGSLAKYLNTEACRTKTKM